MTQQSEPEGANANTESTVDVPNETAIEPTGGLFVDLQRERDDAQRKEHKAIADDDTKNAEYWRGRRNGLEIAIIALCDSGWKPVFSDSYPDEQFVLSFEMSVNTTTGMVSSLIGGKWDNYEEIEDAFDLISEAGSEIVNLNPEEYVTNPEPMAVRLRHESIPAMDAFGEPLMLSVSEAASSQFIYDDGRIVSLKLLDDRVVRVGKFDVDVEPTAP